MSAIFMVSPHSVFKLNVQWYFLANYILSKCLQIRIELKLRLLMFSLRSIISNTFAFSSNNYLSFSIT
jgi:hypothetical protein